jgi:hypothetical protein
MSLASRDAQSQEQTSTINDHVELARRPSPRAPYGLVAAVADAGSMLVDAHHRSVDHLHSHILRGGQRLHDAVPDASPPPAHEAIVASGARAIDGWDVSPRCARSQHPEDAIQDHDLGALFGDFYQGVAEWRMAEQLLFGAASGLAAEGFTPFATTYAVSLLWSKH